MKTLHINNLGVLPNLNLMWVGKCEIPLEPLFSQSPSLVVFRIDGYLGKSISMVSSFGNLNNVTINGDNIETIYFDSPSTVTFSCPNANLTQETVDNVLVYLNNLNVTNGTVDLSGGTSSAPSAIGEAAIVDLVDNGWEVYTN